MVLQVTQPCLPSNKKCFYKWRPDSNNLFSLHLLRCNVLLRKLRRNFSLLHVFCACTGHFKEQICIFLTIALVLYVQKWLPLSAGTKASATLWKNWKDCLFWDLFLFSWMRESGTFERLSLFPERPIDFDDFPEQIRYSFNSRHVWACFWIGSHNMPGQRHSQPTLTSFSQRCMHV